MEQNIFDVADDISFPWLPAYAEATEATAGHGNGNASRMLETIVEETSDDDDKDQRCGSTESEADDDDDDEEEQEHQQQQQQQQQPLSWSQYDHVWSSGGSDAESVIRVETPSDQDTMSERDFICPPKRRKQESFGDGEFLSSELSIYGRTIVRPRIVCEPAANDAALETHEYFMKRHNEPRLRFDEIGHDLFTDSDSLSYASLSRSSSLIQFESLERQLQSESAAHQHPLSGSSPSLYSTESSSHVIASASAGGDATTNTTTRGPINGGGGGGGEAPGAATATLSTFYGGAPGRGKSAGTGSSSQQSGSNLLTTSNLIQKSIGHTTALNISDSELYSTSSSVSSASSTSSSSSNSTSSSSGPASCPESNASSTGSSGYRYASDECGGHRTVGGGVGGGERTPDRVESSSSPDDTGDTEEELLSASVRESTRGSSRWRRHPGPPGHRSKNSIDSLSEDSGYCDLRLVKSKSLTNFGSAENVSFLLCGSTQLPPVSSLTLMQHHHYQQQQPLSMDYIGFPPASVVPSEPTPLLPSSRHHRLSTVCDVDEEDDGEGADHHHHHHQYSSNDADCISAGTKTIDWPNEPNGVAASPKGATISPNVEPPTDEGGRWSNTHNGTKIEHDLCKQRPAAAAAVAAASPTPPPQCITTRLTPPTPPSSDPAESSPSCGSSSVESLSPRRSSPVTARSERRSKNSASHGERRPQAATGLSLSAPDLLLLYCGVAGRGGAGSAGQRHRWQRRHRGQRASSPSSSVTGVPTVGPSGRGALYDPISFTVSSVPECLYLYGARRYSSDDGDEDREHHRYGHSRSPPPFQDTSVASKNVNLYDLLVPHRHRASEVPGKCLPKSVTFCAGSPVVAKPRQNIRASYANLTALNYSDDDEEDAGRLVTVGGVDHDYFLSGRNTFRTSSGTRLGGRSTASAVPRTALRPLDIGTPSNVGFLDMDRERAREVVDARLQEAEDDEDDDEESRIFPLDRDEKNVFNSLLEELSAHFDRNLSIINDQAEAYEPIAAFLHEQRAATGSARSLTVPTVTPPPPPVRATPMTSPPPPAPPPQAPPRRTQIKTNPHVAVTTSNQQPREQQQQQSVTVGRRTFDQDPTNLVTCYAASLERCTFDPTESSSQLNLFAASSRSSGLNANSSSLHPSRAAGTSGGPSTMTTVNDRYSSYSVKREFVASTPNLNYYYGSEAEQHNRPGRGTGDEPEDHRHNSLRNVSAAAFGRSTGILATASTSLSKCGLSKGVSFCPIVSEIIWKSNSGSDLEPDDDDNASIVSNQDFEIDIDDDEFEPDDYDHAQLITHTNTLINANSVEYGLEQVATVGGGVGSVGVGVDGEIIVTPRSVTESNASPRSPFVDEKRSDSYFAENVGDANERSNRVRHQQQLQHPQSQQHPDNNKNNGKSDSVGGNSARSGGSGGGTKMMAMANGEGGGGGVGGGGGGVVGVGASDDDRAMRSVMMSTTASSDESRRNGGATLLATQAALMASEASATGHYNNGLNHGQNNNNNNTNSSLIRNFKNAKADKKNKTFLSRISSGFRFSFRNKSKKALNNINNKETTFGVTTPASNGVGGGGGGGPNYNNNSINTKAAAGSTTAADRSRGSKSSGGNDSATADFIYIPLKDPTRQRAPGNYGPDETHLTRPMNTLGVTIDDSFTGAEDEPDDCEIAVTRPAGSSSYYRSDSSTALNGSDGGGGGGQWPPPNTTNRGGANHVLSSKPPLPKQPPRVVGVSAKRSSTSPASQKHGHAQQHLRASSTPPRELVGDHDEPDSSSSSSYYRRSPPQHHQQSFFSGSDSVEGTHPSAASVSLRVTAPHYGDYSEDNSGGHRYYRYNENNDYDDDDDDPEQEEDRHSAIMGSEQKIGLIETNLDTHETIISGKTRSLMELGGPHHYRHPAAQHHRQQLQVHDPTASAANRRTIGGAGTAAGAASGMKDNHRQTVGSERTGGEPGQRPHKSMEFLLDKENQRNVLPPENELQKSHETGTNLSEHQLRVQASLQRLNIPDWYKQYSGKDGATSMANTTAPASVMGAGGTTATTTSTAGGGLLRKRNSDVGRWTGLSSKTTSLSSLGSHRSDRSPVMLSPSAHSHHGQTGFSRWSTSHLNSNQTSPSVSTRGSFTRGGLNASAMSGYSSGSNATTAGPGYGAGNTIRNSFRQPYLGWRSQEKLSQPRTPAERLASSLLQQQQQQQQHGSGKHKEQQQQQGEEQHTSNKRQHQRQPKDESVVTPEIQSSIIEVTSAIVHYVNDQTNRHSRSRSTSPSQRCWLESSFVGTRPLDSPQTPMIENSSVLGSSHHSQHQQQQHQHHHQSTQQTTAGDHYRFNAGRMNGVEGTGMAAAAAAVPTFSLPTEHQTSPGSATLEDVLASLLGLPADSHRSSAVRDGERCANSRCRSGTRSNY
ncbi:serine-rich adhesin for platelets-like isoform X3 [Anopheles albimanus]|uniref:serine-rich adhesin for platelets-like isoform X3 n=1 Tax=Anopheles albimanus TaxID=7167 RepID=UPI0016412F07|nr:serine-rich adhesin for platelets-like isoform X3 [Anopheles albimanus]